MPPSRAQVAGSGSRRLSPASAQFSYFGRNRLDSPRGDGPAIPKGSRVRWSRHSAGCRRSSPCGRKAGGGATLCTSSVLIWPQEQVMPARKRVGAASSRAANRPRLLAVVIDSGCSLLCAGQPAATQSLVRPLPRSNGIYCIGPVIPGRGSDLSYAGTCEGGPYFSWSATLATPALAQASSCSCVDPELPTPPIASLPIMIGTPPPKARMSATSRCAAYLGSSVRF